LRAQVSDDPDIRTVYFVRKVVKHFPEVPFYVLGIVPFRRWYQFRSAKAESELIKQLATGLKFPGETIVVALERKWKYLRRLFNDINGAEIYRR
jgi:hypothetical protein